MLLTGVVVCPHFAPLAVQSSADDSYDVTPRGCSEAAGSAASRMEVYRVVGDAVVWAGDPCLGGRPV